MDLKLIKTKDIKDLKKQIQNINKENAELQEEWLSTKEAAAFLKIVPRTLKRYRDSGRIAYSKDGRKVWYKKSDLINHIKQHYFAIEKIIKR